MSKAFQAIGPTTFLAPIPAVILCCGDPEHHISGNLITVAWAGVVNSKPPMVSVSIRKERFSHDIIQNTGVFTLNLVNRGLCEAMDFCGVKSGRDIDKLSACGLHRHETGEGMFGLEEAPLYLQCRVEKILELPSHDMFIAQVTQVYVSEQYLRPDGSIDEAGMDLVAYVHGQYYPLSSVSEGFFGYSVASPEVLLRRKASNQAIDKTHPKKV